MAFSGDPAGPFFIRTNTKARPFAAARLFAFPEEHPKMTAERIAQQLHGRKSKTGWMARCPAHDNRDPHWRSVRVAMRSSSIAMRDASYKPSWTHFEHLAYGQKTKNAL
jgi:hypothetical protein